MMQNSGVHKARQNRFVSKRDARLFTNLLPNSIVMFLIGLAFDLCCWHSLYLRAGHFMAGHSVNVILSVFSSSAYDLARARLDDLRKIALVKLTLMSGTATAFVLYRDTYVQKVK